MRYAIFTILLLLINSFKTQQEVDVDSLFSLRGGIYSTSQELVIDTSNNVRVFYTLSGSRPSTYSKEYHGEPFELTEPTVIRALFYQKGNKIGETTQSYIIGRTFNMAVVSIAVDTADFFSYSRGIYVKGCCADSVPPYLGANFWKGWEREINIEFYEPDNTLGFNQEAACRIFGGFSKGLPMKSLAIISKKKYGHDKFKYRIFPNKKIKKFNSFVLRNSGGDFNNTHFRDALLTDLTEPIDMDIQAYRPCVLYINGQYWGIHNVREKINEHYLDDNHNIDKDSVDLLKHRGDAQCGTTKEYKKLLKFLNDNSFESNEKIEELDSIMDIDNYIDYNITEIYVDNGDAGGNIRYWKEQKAGARWRWILFDLDLSFGIGSKTAYKENTLHQMTTLSNEKWPNPAWSTFIIRKLLENDSIRNIYINRFADHLNTIFSEKNVNFKLDSIYNMIKDEMPYHAERWHTSMEKWNIRVDRMREFATKRPYYLRTYIMQKFNLNDTVKVSIGAFDKKMGKVKLNSLKLKKPFEGWYFTDVPITIKAKPKMGYEFVKWEGLESTDRKLTITLTEAISITPIFKRKPTSELSGTIFINEVSIKQDSLTPSEDWIELANISADQQDLSGWYITTKDKEKFKLPEGSTIGAHGYLVVCKRKDDFQSVYNLSEDLLVQGDMDFGFSSKKDHIKLWDADKNPVDSLKYKVKKDFPTIKDSVPRNLERVNPQLAEWQVAALVTPGAQNDGFKGIPKKAGTGEEIELNPWWVIGGLGGILIFVLLGVTVKKKSKGKSQMIEQKVEA
ncbi:CotH kinase family protein [Parvicella tangerina]|uniref:LTD domain-containing protein n=1 Tax=Parvicella tangerina TaxID=2829795 RepID=A0A916N906_9FLAO|nr:CotH kinase family protein [Parvicella tangerina]CAG5076276.1 hypothetical protein CRYO30217_00031 [Parvicella tangerina]